MRLKTALETALSSLLMAILHSVIAAVGLAVLAVQVAAHFTGLKALSSPKRTTLPRVVLITGASSGIGHALAVKFSRPGAVMIITGRNKERLDTVADECRKLGAEVVAGLVDVTNRAEMEKFVLDQDSAHHIDLVIANAGVSAGVLGFRGLEDNTKHMNQINVDGVYHTVLPLLERFKHRKSGQLVAVSSLSAFFDFPRAMAYSAGKSSLLVFWRGLRQVMGRYHVRANVVCPGYVETNFTPHTRQRGGSTPWIIDAGTAADIIIEGLMYDDPVIAFPLPLYLTVVVLRSLPPQVADWIIHNVSPKQFEWSHLG